MEIHHLTLTAEQESRLPLFSDEAAYMAALHRLGAVAAGCLALFALVADHLHLVALLSRAFAGRLAQRVVLALRPIVATPFAPGYIKPVTSRAHMRWLLRYILEQPREHRMPGHLALWVGSCLPDLVGARLIDGLSLNISCVLPEYSDAMALAMVGLADETVVQPADGEMIQKAGAGGLAHAIRATLGISPSLVGNERTTLLGRHVMAQMAQRVGLSFDDVALPLDRSRRTMWRLCRTAVDPRIMMAVARRVMLENLVGNSRASSCVRDTSRGAPAARSETDER